MTSGNNIDFIPNMPTEEVFTMPHKDSVDGTVRASRPLSYAGSLIEDFSLTFKDGRVVDFQAGKNADVLRGLLDTDEGARRLGEVALVPNSSPVSQSGVLFYNTLFDENASSHLALGRAYQFTMQGGEEMSGEAFAQAGGNQSLTHVDFMIGSAETNLDGLLEDGTVEPLMRAGEWVFEV
jgi:aminopeptidase